MARSTVPILYSPIKSWVWLLLDARHYSGENKAHSEISYSFICHLSFIISILPNGLWFKSSCFFYLNSIFIDICPLGIGRLSTHFLHLRSSYCKYSPCSPWQYYCQPLEDSNRFSSDHFVKGRYHWNLTCL